MPSDSKPQKTILPAMKKESNKPLLIFPTLFPIKIIGKNTESFTGDVVSAIRSVIPPFEPSTLIAEYSKNKAYISLTASVFVENQEQLDAVYRTLTALTDAKFVL